MKGTKTLFSKGNDEWETPQDLFDRLNKEFLFDLDPCATVANAKCTKYYDQEDDGLVCSWEGHRVFVNPPYSNWKAWAKKAIHSRALTVMLLPARTDTKAFHEYFYQKPDIEIRFLKGRLKFSDSKNCAPFPSMVVIIRRF